MSVLEHTAIERLQAASEMSLEHYDQPLIITDSGGKDSAVLSDLEGIGYACQAFVIPACGVGARHKRDRCAILAYSNKERRNKQQPTSFANCERAFSDHPQGDVPNAHYERLQKSGYEPGHEKIFCEDRAEHSCGGKLKPGMGGVADGISIGWTSLPEYRGSTDA